MSEITNYKINKFSIDQLIKNLIVLAEKDSEVKENLIFLGKAIEMPILSITTTKRPTRNLLEVAAHP